MTRMTHNTLLVLRALMAAPDREMYGLEIMRGLALKSGTMYPLLDRAEASGWVTVRKEDVSPQAEGRPRRRYYRITAEGAKAAGEAMEREASRLAALGITEAAPEPAGQWPLNVGGIEIPVITDDRQPPGTVSLVSAGTGRDGKPAVSVADMVNVASDEAEPGPCEHRIPPDSYCTRCGRLI